MTTMMVIQGSRKDKAEYLLACFIPSLSSSPIKFYLSSHPRLYPPNPPCIAGYCSNRPSKADEDLRLARS